MSKVKKQSLISRLSAIASQGIQVDTKRLKQNISSQFPDHRFWIREYIANAADAGAAECRVYGRAGDDAITIGVSDNGHGMDKAGVEAFMSKFQSRKTDPEKSVGRFGIGSFSVAAIPEQCAYRMVTSTGDETWRMETGSLLGSEPITVESITPVLPCGTTFEVTFVADPGLLLHELGVLQRVVRKSLHFLPITVCFDDPHRDSGRRLVRLTPDDWVADPMERFCRRYQFKAGSCRYDVAVGIGPTRHQLYQHRVLINENSRKDRLLGLDILGRPLYLENLSIRVDSPDFELPIGRHRLCNPDVLERLSGHLRREIIPGYLAELVPLYDDVSCVQHGLLPAQLETLFCAWLNLSPSSAGVVRTCRMFRTHDARRVSFQQLVKQVQGGAKVYIESGAGAGIDYAVFDGTVLSAEQPKGALDFLMAYFGENIVDLGEDGLVQEAPASQQPDLSPQERMFERMMGFHPEVLSQYRGPRPSAGGTPDALADLPKSIREKLSRESRRATHDLEDLKWRLGHLVQQDGQTPCRRSLYVCRADRVTLNLNHPDIHSLVVLSGKAPDLAAHFAMAMCITASHRNGVLDHLSAAAKEELINMDAICRCTDAGPEARAEREAKKPASDDDDLRDFMRNLQDDLPF